MRIAEQVSAVLFRQLSKKIINKGVFHQLKIVQHSLLKSAQSSLLYVYG